MTTTVVTVVQCKEWGDETRKLRLSFPEGSGRGLSYTGEELQAAILSKIRHMLGRKIDEDGREWVEMYHDERECFVSLKDDKLCNVNLAPKFGRLVRCIAHIHSDTITSSNFEMQQQQTTPLAIMGRYFHYDSNGLEYCGK